MQSGITYTEPQLCNYDNDLHKKWFVWFDLTNHDTGESDRGQKRGNINSYQTIRDRTAAGNAAIALWKKNLKGGWHRFEIAEKKPQPPLNPLSNLTLGEALDFAIKNCMAGKQTQKDYRCTYRFVKQSATRMNMVSNPIAEIEDQHIMLLLHDVKVRRNWSNKAYNKNIGYLAGIFKVLKTWKIIKVNPVHGIEKLPVAESEKYEPYTADEQSMIVRYLKVHHYRFYVYVMILYLTGIRPKEILALQIKHVDLPNQVVSLLPDLNLENTKTKKIRRVPLSNELIPFLQDLQLDLFDKECYVFGSPYPSGKGNKGSAGKGLTGALHPDYFKPSMVQIKRDTVTKLWKRIVIDKLGIHKYLYAAKHSGAAAFILSGEDLDTLKELFGHSSKFTTETYAKKVLQQVRAEKIRSSSIKFA